MSGQSSSNSPNGANIGQRGSSESMLPTHHNGHAHPSHEELHNHGESGRSGIHPLKFLMICFKGTTPVSRYVNILWPFVPAAIVFHWARPEEHMWDFILSYIAMVPSANVLGFAGGELAHKLPKVLGVIVETALSSVVEIILFMILVARDNHNNLIPVIQAAILGSILANLLLCLGLCFFMGGLRRNEQKFHQVISETGSGLLLVAGFGLLIPSAFFSALSGSTSTEGPFTFDVLVQNTRDISHATSVLLIIAFFTYVFDPPSPLLFTFRAAGTDAVQVALVQSP